MLRLGYDRKLAIGIICAGGSLGTMIPPSVVLIVYGLTAGVSIGDLFLAAVVPGADPGLPLHRLRRDPLRARTPRSARRRRPRSCAIPLAEKLALLKGLILPIMIIVWVLGSIYGGIASITEAAGVGVVGAIVSAALRRELNLADAARGGARGRWRRWACCIWLTFGANAFIGIYNIMGGTGFLRSLIAGLPLPPDRHHPGDDGDPAGAGLHHRLDRHLPA